MRQYLAVEQARFSDRLHPVLDIDPATLAAAVPSFALQHLVENAVRHGIAKRTDAGRVVVTARRVGDDLELSVEDDGAGSRRRSPPRQDTASRTRASACGRCMATARPCRSPRLQARAPSRAFASPTANSR